MKNQEKLELAIKALEEIAKMDDLTNENPRDWREWFESWRANAKRLAKTTLIKIRDSQCS